MKISYFNEFRGKYGFPPQMPPKHLKTLGVGHVSGKEHILVILN